MTMKLATGQGDDPQSKALAIIEAIQSHGIDGVGTFLKGSSQLAAEYAEHTKYSSTQERIDALIKWQAAHSFGTGFVTGLGGVITLPVTLPMSIGATWILNARMAGAIAELSGHSPKSSQVRTMCTLVSLGNKFIGESLRNSGVHVGKKLALNAISSIPGTALREINRQVGFRLLTKAGQTGVVNLTKLVPFIGGVVGGGIDAAACVYTGRRAAKAFADGLDIEQPDEGSDQ